MKMVIADTIFDRVHHIAWAHVYNFVPDRVYRRFYKRINERINIRALEEINR
jgi:hypothetical protein